MVELTEEQRAAVESRGKVIVSASAGSGKTFVMIKKLVDAVAGGADLDDVLGVTFTKKAAAQLKEKLRSALINRVEGADEATAAHLKAQLGKIPSANISTIHSFCARLLRTYFYALDIDGGFDIISDDDSVAKTLKARAMDDLFERLYAENDSDFKIILESLMRKRSDASVKKLISSAYSSVRSTAFYGEVLKNAEKLYTEEGFKRVCGECLKRRREKLQSLLHKLTDFEKNFCVQGNKETYARIFAEMRQSLEAASENLFDGKSPFTVTRKPADRPEDKQAGETFKAFKEALAKRFNSARGDYADEQTERESFFKSGELAIAFSRVLMQFDAEYTEVKRDENKLDYNDLEHLTLKLLTSPEYAEIRGEIAGSFKYVFVDEYQDVNPVQEKIISSLGGEVFLVGDVKQAIYGFRGSKSLFFAQKFNKFMGGGGTALRLSSNFRSSDGVVGFVNALFSEVMRTETCGFNYAESSVMVRGGAYPENYGKSNLLIFGKDEKKERELGVYSVLNGGEACENTREGLAVAALAKKLINGEHFDLAENRMVKNKYSDICILTRKNKGASAEGIVRALRDNGIPVSGAGESNICVLPEVKQFLDILSLIDNAEQDVPLVTALLSPLGNMTENELAYVRIAAKENRLSFGDKKNPPFRECCRKFAEELRGDIAEKLKAFYAVLERLRGLSEILNVGAIADEILEKYGLEATYGAGGGEKLKNVLRLVAEGADLPLAAFLEKVKSGGYDIPAPASAPSDSVKIMTMHASKGLEFPIVILADICRTFKGTEYNEMPFDDEFGFAPKCYDRERMLVCDTVLRKLCKQRNNAEELKNELNLFYVACTRAMCELYVLAEEIEEYDQYGAMEARSYSQLFDMSNFFPAEISAESREDAETEKSADALNPAVADEIVRRFARPYAYGDSVNLPVKSSASAIIKDAEEPYFVSHKLFGGEEETGTERGTAYHRFLELCDFKKRDLPQIEEQIKAFVAGGKLKEEQADLLSADELAEILSMPVFSDLGEAKLYREREFLCRLPANEILKGVTAADFVLVQGAIDLFAEGDFGYRIIDYKYSHKSDEELIKKYSAQLNLYRKAASRITGADEKNISAVLVNIRAKRQINL